MKNTKVLLVSLLLAALLMLSASACADASVSDVKAVTNANGTVSVSWSYAGGSDPVAYVFCAPDDPSISYLTGGLAKNGKATLPDILCGYEYIVELFDAQFNFITGIRHTVHHEDFTDLKTLKFQDVGVVKMDAGENKFRNRNIVKQPNAEKIAQAVSSGSDHRFFVEVYTPSITKGERSYLFMLAVTAPNGYTETYSGNFVLENVGKRTNWTIWPLALEPFCKEEALTAGKYTVRLYLDGGLVDTKTITFR